MSCSLQPEAELVILGKTFTAEGDTSFTDAVAVRDGIVLCVGDDAKAMIGKDTKVIKSDGLVLPGFIDCHSHGPEGLRVMERFKKLDSLSFRLSPFGTEKDEAAKENYILDYQKLMLSKGITSCLDAWVNPYGFELIEAYEKLDKEGKIVVRTFGACKITPENRSYVDTVSRLSLSSRGGNFELNCVKIYIDGTLEDSSAWIAGTYPGEFEAVPQGFWTTKQSGSLVGRANGNGLYVHAHTVGENALDSYISAVSNHGANGARNSATHLQLVDSADFDYMKSCNLCAVVNPFFFTREDGIDSLYSRLIGVVRVSKMYPLKELIASGIHTSIGSDFPVSGSLDFPTAIYNMTYGRGESRGIEVNRALLCATIEGAYVLGIETSTGSITAGKRADITILDKDITDCSPEEMKNASVTHTIVGGHLLYRKSDSVR